MGMDHSKLSVQEQQIVKDLEKPMHKFGKDKQMAAFREAMAKNMAQERGARAVREINESIAMQKNMKNQAKLLVDNLIALHPNVAQHIRDFIAETDRVRRADLMDRILFDVGHLAKNHTRELLESCQFTLTHGITVEKPDLSVKTIQTEFGEINIQEILGEKEFDALQKQINAEIEESVSKADVVEQEINLKQEAKKEEKKEAEVVSVQEDIGEEIYACGPSEEISTSSVSDVRPIGNNLYMDEQGRIVDGEGTEYKTDETGAIWGPDGKTYGKMPPQTAEEVDAKTINENNGEEEVAQ